MGHREREIALGSCVSCPFVACFLVVNARGNTSIQLVRIPFTELHSLLQNLYFGRLQFIKSITYISWLITLITICNGMKEYPGFFTEGQHRCSRLTLQSQTTSFIRKCTKFKGSLWRKRGNAAPRLLIRTPAQDPNGVSEKSAPRTLEFQSLSCSCRRQHDKVLLRQSYFWPNLHKSSEHLSHLRYKSIGDS